MPFLFWVLTRAVGLSMLRPLSAWLAWIGVAGSIMLILAAETWVATDRRKQLVQAA